MSANEATEKFQAPPKPASEATLAAPSGSARRRRRQRICTINAFVFGGSLAAAMLSDWPITKAIQFTTAALALFAVWVFAGD